MKIIFMGTPEFAQIILHKLAETDHEIVAVFTKEDSVSKRGSKLIPTPVKVEAVEHNFAVFSPKTLKDENVIEEIRALEPDVICVAAYGKILPKAVLDIPKQGCLNVHASLLPRWRGAAPIERAILAGDKFQGVSIMKMEEGLDTGDYCAQVKIDAKDKTATELTEELAQAGAKALIDVLGTSSCTWTKQDETFVTYADKIGKKELNLNPSSSSAENFRRVLASADSHPAKCVVAGKPVRVMLSALSDNNTPQGKMDAQNKKLLLGCSEGALVVIKIKPDGKKEMDATSFIAGSANVREGNAIWEAI